MKTTLDIVDILWQVINGSSLKTEITGKIYKHRRPAGVNKEDIVVNCLPITGEQLQKSIGNVNIHVPDVIVKVDGVQQKLPNQQRLKELATEAMELLMEGWGSDYIFTVQQQLLIEDDEADDHYINIRLEFNSENL